MLLDNFLIGYSILSVVLGVICGSWYSVHRGSGEGVPMFFITLLLWPALIIVITICHILGFVGRFLWKKD